VRIEVTPEPAPAERAAIEAALKLFFGQSAAAVFGRPLWNLDSLPDSWRAAARFEAIDDGV